ncbi:hypothetical protein [Ruegeria arenilitoris]|uniref:hypothetical protein n=1 Tax=Ruegeria arenilitoris TaxID=1173585 RepID=UPI00147BF170|nr:hypothetical protein [Ruegeria arenilitoris]
MPNARISFPEKTDLGLIFGFAKELDYYSGHDRLVIEMPDKAFCSPFTMLILGAKIKHLKDRCENLTVVFDNWNNHSYLSHMGFFSMCGFDHGNSMGQAPGNSRYLPITELREQELVEKPTDEYEEMQDLLQRSVDRIALVLAHDQNENRDLFDVLGYSLREVFRNSFEHGETDKIYYCAQYWPTSNKVEFAAKISGSGNRPPSAMSLLSRRDYAPSHRRRK